MCFRGTSNSNNGDGSASVEIPPGYSKVRVNSIAFTYVSQYVHLYINGVEALEGSETVLNKNSSTSLQLAIFTTDSQSASASLTFIP